MRKFKQFICKKSTFLNESFLRCPLPTPTWLGSGLNAHIYPTVTPTDKPTLGQMLLQQVTTTSARHKIYYHGTWASILHIISAQACIGLNRHIFRTEYIIKHLQKTFFITYRSNHIFKVCKVHITRLPIYDTTTDKILN